MSFKLLSFANVLCLMVSSAALAVGCASDPDAGVEDVEITLETQDGPQECDIDCAAPPEGCTYEGALMSGPCHLVTCGTLVCNGGGDDPPVGEEECPVPVCPAPGIGCHYEGAVLYPCHEVTCGQLVCDGSGN